MRTYTEETACVPEPVRSGDFNQSADVPYGLETEHVHGAMVEFIDFIGFVNAQLYTKSIQRLETMMMPANSSSIVGEFMASAIPKHCKTLVKNTYHNGHPDLVPAGAFAHDAVQHAPHGIEIKASRYASGWQGHNPENVWLMVFVFDSNRPVDSAPRPFQFVTVAGAQLSKSEWKFSGRSETSRRTITASVTPTGHKKIMANWIYRASIDKSI